MIAGKTSPTIDGQVTATRLGACAYLRKPISVLIFLDALTRVIAETRAGAR